MKLAIRVVFVPLVLVLAACASAQKSQSENGRQVRLAMAGQMAQRGDWAGAFQIADAIHREDPENATALLLRGKALRKQGMPVEAEADVRRVLQLQPRNPEAHAEMGILFERSARPQEAMAEHQEAKRLAPTEPRYLNNLGFALLLRGRMREAVPLFEEALKVAPGSPLLRNNLGFALAGTGDFSHAAEQFRLGGTSLQAKNNLGFAYERSGNLPQAYDLYLQAVRIDPGDAVARSNLEHVARKLGRELPPEVPLRIPGTGEKGGS